jgi:hypothetical protein
MIILPIFVANPVKVIVVVRGPRQAERIPSSAPEIALLFKAESKRCRDMRVSFLIRLRPKREMVAQNALYKGL